MRTLIYSLFPVYQFFYHLGSTAVINVYLWSLKLKLRRLGSNNRVYFAHIVEPYNVSIGHHVYINKNCDIITTGSRVTIGNYVMVGPNVTFVAQNHDVSDWKKPMILSQRYHRGDIRVGDDVWIGANATILSGVTINRGAVIAAGSVVTKDVPPFSVVGGVPAMKIKDRIAPDLIRKALRVDLTRFSNETMNWGSWGVGHIA